MLTARVNQWCRERGLNPRPSDVSDTTRGFARHTNALRLPYESDALPTAPPRLDSSVPPFPFEGYGRFEMVLQP